MEIKRSGTDKGRSWQIVYHDFDFGGTVIVQCDMQSEYLDSVEDAERWLRERGVNTDEPKEEADQPPGAKV